MNIDDDLKLRSAADLFAWVQNMENERIERRRRREARAERGEGGSSSDEDYWAPIPFCGLLSDELDSTSSPSQGSSPSTRIKQPAGSSTCVAKPTTSSSPANSEEYWGPVLFRGSLSDELDSASSPSQGSPSSTPMKQTTGSSKCVAKLTTSSSRANSNHDIATRSLLPIRTSSNKETTRPASRRRRRRRRRRAKPNHDCSRRARHS